MSRPEPDAVCSACGDVYDEHRQDAKGVHECTVVGCDCIMFEPEDDPDAN